MVVPKPHIFFNQVRLAGLLLFVALCCSLPARATSSAATSTATTHHRRHHAVAQAAAPAPTTRSHGRHRSHEVSAAPTATVSSHGRHHHTTQPTAAAETVVRDRHGHVIRRVFHDLAHKPHRPLQSEEPSIQAKAGEEVVPKESEELPHEYGSYTRVYALFDEATNARLSGNNKSAIATLSKALDLVPANAHGGPSVLTLNMEYELAQAAEASGDLGLASRYYARAVADRPNFTEAFVRLANVLARNGQAGAALRAARSAVEHNPSDPRAHTVLSVMLSRNGLGAEAKVEKIRAQGLLGDNTRIDAMPATAVETPASENSAAAGATQTTMPSNSQGTGLDATEAERSGSSTSGSVNASSGNASDSDSVDQKDDSVRKPSSISPKDSPHSPITSPSTPGSAPEPGS